ncbi:MAG: flagellar hook assembly protein FlgD [Methylophilaceae bacterium]
MTVTATSNEASQTLLDSVNGSKNIKKSAADAAQDRFMTLLVTQMKNQDPLNPMDNAQVTSQMAQLSTVSGIDKLNATLETMMSNAQASQSLQASSLIGHEAFVAGNQIHFNGSSGYFGVDLPANTDSLNVTISDANGNKLRQLSLGKQNAGTIPLSWDGYSDDGTRVANGDYTFTVSATTAGNKASVDTLSLEKINSITSGAGGVKLNLSNASSVTTADLRQIF